LARRKDLGEGVTAGQELQYLVRTFYHLSRYTLVVYGYHAHELVG